MASILSGNSLQAQSNAMQQDPMAQINAVINQIMGSENPSQTFQQFINSTPAAKAADDLAKQYGNGVYNKETFMRIAAAQGKQALAQQLMQQMGLT